MDQIEEIPIEKIRVGEHEQRIEKEDQEIGALAASIARLGVLNPIIVVEDGDKVVVLAGHRRLVAAGLCGKDRVPCIVRRSEEAVDSEVTFAENYFRKDLSPVELAGALKDCIDQAVMTVKELAAGFHRSEHWVHSMIAIAGWPSDVQEAIHVKAISVSAASNLALVTDSTYRDFLLRNAAESGATARTTAAWLQAWRAFQPPEEAITQPPVAVGAAQVPLVPQAPCLSCGVQHPVNEMSHVPMCGGCIQVIRKAVL